MAEVRVAVVLPVDRCVEGNARVDVARGRVDDHLPGVARQPVDVGKDDVGAVGIGRAELDGGQDVIVLDDGCATGEHEATRVDHVVDELNAVVRAAGHKAVEHAAVVDGRLHCRAVVHRRHLRKRSVREHRVHHPGRGDEACGVDYVRHGALPVVRGELANDLLEPWI